MISGPYHQSALGALEPFVEPGSPAEALYEYITHERKRSDMDINDFLEAMRRSRVLVARFDHDGRTEWLFPAMDTQTMDSTRATDNSEPWVLVSESENDGEWNHQHRIHEAGVASRGLPEPEDIIHVSNADTVVPALALANKVDTGGEERAD